MGLCRLFCDFGSTNGCDASGVGDSEEMMKPSEKQLQSAILDYLTMRHFLVWRNNSGMAQSTNAKTGASYRIKLGKSGSPDIIGMTKSGQWLGIEVKNDKGKQRESQKGFEQLVLENKGVYLLVHSWDEFISQMETVK